MKSKKSKDTLTKVRIDWQAKFDAMEREIIYDRLDPLHNDVTALEARVKAMEAKSADFEKFKSHMNQEYLGIPATPTPPPPAKFERPCWWKYGIGPVDAPTGECEGSCCFNDERVGWETCKMGSLSPHLASYQGKAPEKAGTCGECPENDKGCGRPRQDDSYECLARTRWREAEARAAKAEEEAARFLAAGCKDEDEINRLDTRIAELVKERDAAREEARKTEELRRTQLAAQIDSHNYLISEALKAQEEQYKGEMEAVTKAMTQGAEKRAVEARREGARKERERIAKWADEKAEIYDDGNPIGRMVADMIRALPEEE